MIDDEFLMLLAKYCPSLLSTVLLIASIVVFAGCTVFLLTIERPNNG